MKKHKSIIKLIALVNHVFGGGMFVTADHWEEDLCAIGLQKDNKLIYISTYGDPKNEYFYELELLVDDPEIVYISQGVDNVTQERLLEVMSEFFEIKRK